MIDKLIANHNKDARSFAWTARAESMLEKIKILFVRIITGTEQQSIPATRSIVM
jgi:hypothetical protein